VGSVLIDQWLGPDAARAIRVVDEASVSIVRQAVRDAARELPELEREAIVTAASEVARNQLVHARDGMIAIRTFVRGETPGVEVIAADRGPGIRSISQAITTGIESAHGLGVGLSGAFRLADEADLDVRAEEGSCLWLRKLAARVSRRREVGIVARHHPAETTCGDHAGFRRHDDGTLVLAVADGLGHGPAALEGAEAAIGAATSPGARSISAAFSAARDAVTSERGAVLALALIDEEAGVLEHVGVGDVIARVIGPKRATQLAGSAGYLGDRVRRSPRLERIDLAKEELVMLATDGLKSKIEISPQDPIFWAHPAAIAEHLMTRWFRGTDDALVLVAK
jgi:anti-sigma regulatory factor (Ser/Thr protein kinase)